MAERQHDCCVTLDSESLPHPASPQRCRWHRTFGALQLEAASSWYPDVLVPFPAAVFLGTAAAAVQGVWAGRQRKEAELSLSPADGYLSDGSGLFLFCLVIPFPASVIRILYSTG